MLKIEMLICALGFFLTIISASSYGLLEFHYVTYMYNAYILSARLGTVRPKMENPINYHTKTVVSSLPGRPLPHACEKGYVELLGAMPNFSRTCCWF